MYIIVYCNVYIYCYYYFDNFCIHNYILSLINIIVKPIIISIIYIMLLHTICMSESLAN